MIPHTIRAVAALSALALTQASMAIDFGHNQGDSEQCNMSSIYADYVAPTQERSTPTEYFKGESPETIVGKRQQLHAWLSANQAPVAKAAFSLELTRQDLIDIGAVEDASYQLTADPRRVQVGVDKPVEINVRFDGLAGKRINHGGRDHMGGSVSRGLDGEMVWSAIINSAGAKALRIGFEDVNLPAGTELYVYNNRGEAHGPYTGRGPNKDGVFWSNAIFSDSVTLQLHHYGDLDTVTLDNLGFRVQSISHIGSRFNLSDFMNPEAAEEKVHCNYNEPCVVTAGGGNEVSEAKNAVALMLYTSGGGSYICSGGLLADTVGSSTIPYFLTANHCISKGREANSLQTYFDFDTSCADRYAQNGSYPGTNGSSIKSSSRTSDYTLLELSSTPGGPSRAYLGWDNTPVANSADVDLYRISHPAGAPQAYSRHQVNTNKGTCSSWPRGNWIYSNDIQGATEGGSSGSPVLNGSGLVVGQLSGGCGTNVGDTCDTVNNSTVDGALAAYWSSVEQFLDPGGEPPPPPPPGEASVDSVSVSISKKGPWWRADATARIIDGSGNPVANATVSGTFGGDATGGGSAITDANGVASFSSNKTRNQISSATFCVDTINGSAATGTICG